MRRLLTGLVASVLTVAGLTLPASTAKADHHRDGDRHGRDGWRHDREHRNYGWWGYYTPYRVYTPAPYPYAPYPGYTVTYQSPYFGVRVCR